MIDPALVAAFIERYERITGRPPRPQEVVAEFDGKLLNVLMALWELKERQKENDDD